ncbi:MAG: helix-turn-helix transcriptional regulator [Planctomycetes bacterium]|nr:helix-turn-helix transcriptional regulator [Planctomycetota bacterium]
MPASIDPANAITVLALLEEAPRCGYDLKQIIDERFNGIVEITAGTLYYTLKKLETQGWARSSAARPRRGSERRAYRITAAGRRAFLDLVEKACLQADQMYSLFDIAVYFTPRLAPHTLQRACEKRLDDLSRGRRRLLALEEKNPGRWPFHLYYLKEKARELIDLNERWCLRIKRKIQEKTLQKV